MMPSMGNSLTTAEPARDRSARDAADRSPANQSPEMPQRRPKPREVVIEKADLPLERAFRWERERPSDVFMVQPMGGGAVREITWAETLGEARRMAAYLGSLDLPPGSSIGLLSKNCAHFIMMD